MKSIMLDLSDPNSLTPLTETLGVSASSFDMKVVLVGIFFSIVGWIAWRYGRKKQSSRHLVLAIALMAYPYFVWNFLWSVLVGVILTLFLFWP